MVLPVSLPHIGNSLIGGVKVYLKIKITYFQKKKNIQITFTIVRNIDIYLFSFYFLFYLIPLWYTFISKIINMFFIKCDILFIFYEHIFKYK